MQIIEGCYIQLHRKDNSHSTINKMVLQSLPNLQNRIQQHFRNSKMWLCYFTAHAYVTSLFLKYVFKNFQTNILVTLLTLYQYNRFKLPLALTDDTGSIEAIAFSSIAEDLVERNAYQASQNMKIHATDHAASLQTAVGKNKTIPHRNEYWYVIKLLH